MLNNRISLKENELNDSQKIINKLHKEDKNNKTPIYNNKIELLDEKKSKIKIEVPQIESKKLNCTFGKKTINKINNLNNSKENCNEDYLKYNLHKNLDSKPSSYSKILHEYLPEKYKNNEKYKLNLFKYLRKPSISNNKSLSCKNALYKEYLEKFDGNITKNNINEYYIIKKKNKIFSCSKYYKSEHSFYDKKGNENFFYFYCDNDIGFFHKWQKPLHITSMDDDVESDDQQIKYAKKHCRKELISAIQLFSRNKNYSRNYKLFHSNYYEKYNISNI